LESFLGDSSSDDEYSAQPRERMQCEVEEEIERYTREMHKRESAAIEI